MGMFDAPQYEHEINDFNRHLWDPTKPNNVIGRGLGEGLNQGAQMGESLWPLIVATFTLSWLIISGFWRLGAFIVRKLNASR
jgi:hypothetical protein